MKNSKIQFFNGPKPDGRKWFSVRNLAPNGSPAEIMIYDRIGKDFFSDEGIGAKDFKAMMDGVNPTRDLVVSINSPGGNVHDGMAIHSMLSRHKGKVTARVDGVAASITSVICMAADVIEMPRNALMMIHDPFGMVQGSAREMREAADMLDKHRDAIVSAYDRTGLPRDTIINMMAAETWMTGEEAVKNGFADMASAEMSIAASIKRFDFSCFFNPPNIPKNKTPSVVGDQQNGTMNKKTILALLALHSFKVSDDASDSGLMALLDQVPDADQENRDKAINWLKENPTNVKPPAPTPPATPPASTPPAPSNAGELATVLAQLNLVNEQNAAITARLESQRRLAISAKIDNLISNDQLEANQRENWINRAMADDTVMDDLSARPSMPPGNSAVNVDFLGSSPQDVLAHLGNLRKPIKSMIKGNRPDVQAISRNATAIANAIAQHRDKLNGPLNANTIDTDLKRNVILSDIMRAFKRRIINLNVFSTVFRNVPLEGTNKVAVPFYENDTTSSTDYNASNGYVMGGNTDTGSRDVTINKRKYIPMDFTSDEFRRQPYFKPEMNMMLKAEQLAIDVWNNVLTVLTQSNYSAAPVSDIAPASFDIDNIVDFAEKADGLDWPEMGRSLILGHEYKASLLKDTDLRHALNSGSTAALRDGSTGNLVGFDLFYSPRIPTNSQNMQGFYCLPSAVLVATAPILPAPGVMNDLLNYDVVVDPELGISFEYRYWGDADTDTDKQVVECNYGFDRGNEKALGLISNAASSA